MDKKLSDYRKSYDKGSLLESTITKNPFELFDQWFKEVEAQGGVEEVNAMHISTLSKEGYPESRVVLLKHILDDHFVFYTNYNSQKGKAIAAHPKVGVSFFWPSLERQVRIRGLATPLDQKQSEAYFNLRPRGSQIGAWASAQSSTVASREALQESFSFYEKKFADKLIPKPEHWGGYRIAVSAIEFWQGRPNRLHDRIRFIRNDYGTWDLERLAP